MTEQLISVPYQSGAVDNMTQPFQIEGVDVSGRAVRLGTTLNTILSAHDYPEPISRLMGEVLALTALLGSILKFDGILTIQAKASGIISLLVADFETPGSLRGYASFDNKKLGNLSNTPSFKDLMGEGYLAITIDQGQDMERYQGIVELSGENLSQCAMVYFGSSEQTLTSIRLASYRDETTNDFRAGGIMVQYLPKGGVGGKRLLNDESLDGWDRASILMKSIKDEELVSSTLELNQLLFRVFHEDGVRIFDPTPLSPDCRCTYDKICGALSKYSKEDLVDMAEEDGKIRANCEFCKKTYEYKP
jgi:molecular chaperone Hsp33